MKTTAIAVAALLASVAVAQPHHGRHGHQKKDLHKRKYETTWVTSTMYATLIIDEHGTSLQEPSPAQFYPSTTSEEATTSTTSTSTSTTSQSTSESSTSTTPEHTSVQPEPTTSSTTEAAAATTEKVPTTTAQVPVYTPATTEIAQPTYGSGSGSSGGGSGYAGDLTFYDLVGPGACGNNLVGMTPSGSSPSDPAVVALAFARFTAANPNQDPLCGKIIKFTVGGKTGYGRVQDKCANCAYDDLDINPEAFANVANTGDGRVHMSWEWA